ncbi:MAG: HlyD family secretion protein [Xanthobacteraceae bacterium]
MTRRLRRYAILIAALATIAVAFWLAIRPQPLIVQGEVEATRVDLAPRVTGRVEQLNADVGDTAKAGKVVVKLGSPQLLASLVSAEAALLVAKADRARVYSTRREIIDERKAQLERAEADIVLAKQIYDRQAQLVQEGHSPQQRMDEATNKLDAANRARDAAQANLELARRGSSDEEKALADARVKQAEATLEQTRTDVTELTIRAPVNGEVTTRVAELGVLFSPGAQLLSMIDLSDVWLTFNLREDLLAGLKVGDTFDVRVPAMANKIVTVHVTAINAQGQYANWRATKATGDFDLRTFEVRAKPVTPAEGLRPGMSGIVAWDRSASGSRK